MLREIEEVVRAYEAGRLSRRELVGWLGAVVASAMASSAAGDAAAQTAAPAASSTFRSVGLNHIALRVTDIPRARDFYAKHLGLTVLDENPSICFMACGGNNFVALFRSKTAGLDHYCYTIDDYVPDRVVERLRAASLAPERHEDRVYFNDADGLQVQLSGEWDDYPGGRPRG
jgi:catechol 2,3-dioxygenase-like lactoylglutathione lyase family enzyme